MNTQQVVFGTKGVRSFGDGMMSVALAQYANTIGLSGFQAGLVATSALVGTSVTTWLVGQYVERIGRRRILIWAAFLAIATGLAYAASSSLAILLGVAFVGTVNPTSGDVSPSLPIEQAILAQESAVRNRVGMFARFNVVGSLAAAFGALASGSTVLLEQLPGVGTLGAIRLLFVFYSVLGVGTLLLTMKLTAAAELVRTEKPTGPHRLRHHLGRRQAAGDVRHHQQPAGLCPQPRLGGDLRHGRRRGPRHPPQAARHGGQRTHADQLLPRAVPRHRLHRPRR